MRFSDELLEEIKARLPVSQVVGQRVALKKQGREWKGLSPFNKEKTPSFFVNDQKERWFDFSSGKNGNIFDFLMLTEGLTFPEAVERLAQRAGVIVPKAEIDDARERRRHTLYEVLDLAAKFFEQNLSSPRGAVARGYLANRAIQPAIQVEFRLGYAPAERFALKEFLGKKAVPIADMIDAGLLIAGDDIPIPYDRFRDRVIIPIHDQKGRVIGFGGRTLNDQVQPKYLNSPETPLFHKGTTVFNFHRARQAAHENGSVVVVEGYMDALAIYQAGIKAVVATMGTAFTEEQIASLWRLSNEPVVCFDSDRAGIAAANRSIDRMLPVLRVGQTFRFALMEGGKDPDELIRDKGLEAFKAVLAGSLSLWEMLWERETANVDIRTPDRQAALEHRLQGIIRLIQNKEVYTAYNRTCRMQLANLFWEVTRQGHTRSPAASSKFVRSNLSIEKDGRFHGIQKILIGLLVHYPQFVDLKGEIVSEVTLSPRLEDFRQALYDLLIMSEELSVQMIYSRLKPNFYEVLQDVHGERTSNKDYGHRLMMRFPIVKNTPPMDFISDCIDHFVMMLKVEQMAEHIDQLTQQADSDTGESFLAIIRQHQKFEEDLKVRDMELAERATEVRRIRGDPSWKVAA